MRRLIIILFFTLLPALAGAQSATINSPISEAKIVVEQIDLVRNQGGFVRVSIQTSTDQTKRFLQFDIATAEMTSFITATAFTVRGGETGSNARKYNFRVLGWLSDNNKIVDNNGDAIAVTLVP